MARPTLELITALRATADRIESGARYHWNHMGSCNCGHLAQTLTAIDSRHLHQMALRNAGDWTEQARDYCVTSGYPLDRVIDVMVAAGLNTNDIANLERLSDDAVLRRMGYSPSSVPPDFRDRDDAVRYIRTWADILEEDWREHMNTNAKREARVRADVVMEEV